MVRLWRHYEAGFLWRAGGVADQPERYLQAMEILSSEVARIVAEDAERERRRGRAGGLKVHGAEGTGTRRVI